MRIKQGGKSSLDLQEQRSLGPDAEATPTEGRPRLGGSAASPGSLPSASSPRSPSSEVAEVPGGGGASPRAPE